MFAIFNKMDHFCSLFPTVCKLILIFHKHTMKLFVSKQEWQVYCKKIYKTCIFHEFEKIEFGSNVIFGKFSKKSTLISKIKFSFWSVILAWLRVFNISYQIFCYSLSTAVMSLITLSQLIKKSTYLQANRQQPAPLLYSIDIWPARISRLTQRETNHYITSCQAS